MIIAKSIAKIRREVAHAKRGGKKVGFVPTMGALHPGHLSLIARAKKNCDYVVVSIFVNPLQFGPREDFKKYPRNVSKDLRILYNEQVDMLFLPGSDVMYSEDFSIILEEELLSRPFCGKYRPGHFQGVCTVVAKLFNIVVPDTAFFGQKDYQQFKVIERMVRDLDFPVKLVMCPIIREESGLAMSSRNQYLKPAMRRRVAGIYQALKNAKAACSKHKNLSTLHLIRQVKRDILAVLPHARIEYIDAVDPDTLVPLRSVKSHALIAVAVYVDRVRLIDNILI